MKIHLQFLMMTCLMATTSSASETKGPSAPAAGGPLGSLVARLQAAMPVALLQDGSRPSLLAVQGVWRDGTWSGSIINRSDRPMAVREIVLFEGDHGLPPATPVYGESFQMLAQIVGTLAAPVDLGGYSDRKHYRIPEPADHRTASGLLTLMPGQDQALALAFTSCRTFIGRIGFNATRLRVFIDTENLILPAKGSWTLERFGCIIGADRSGVLDQVAHRIQEEHPRRLSPAPPTGWCSWYYFYEFVTAADIRSNLAAAKARLPAIRYIQIDDGYQSKMGDWLDTGSAFGGNAQQILAEIKQAGFEPAIWVAPFIAEKTSRVFIDHPDWFIKGADGKPLDSSTVGFGGWRCAPWYVLDGTNPAVQRHLEHVFRTMREQWGVTYFKLDANYWGAIHGGVHHDPSASRIEAYRRGMAAIQRGAGEAFILGCNAPIWPSLGLVDGMRTSNDISRSWNDFSMTGRENIARAWQNGRLWWGDPDCLVLTDRSQRDIVAPPARPRPVQSDDEFLLHAAVIRASGGMVLSGDDLGAIRPDRFAHLEKLLKPTGKAMRFADGDFTAGRVEVAPGVEEIALFNWGEGVVQRRVAVGPDAMVTDFWTGAALTVAGDAIICDLKPHAAVLLVVRHQQASGSRP